VVLGRHVGLPGDGGDSRHGCLLFGAGWRRAQYAVCRLWCPSGAAPSVPRVCSVRTSLEW